MSRRYFQILGVFSIVTSMIVGSNGNTISTTANQIICANSTWNQDCGFASMSWGDAGVLWTTKKSCSAIGGHNAENKNYSIVPGFWTNTNCEFGG